MESTQDTLLAVLNILRRLPPAKYQKNIGALTNLLPDYADKILSLIDSPLCCSSLPPTLMNFF